MAQTERDNTSILALLADKVTGDINPQDLRDALASQEGYGGMIVSIAAGDPTMADVPVTPTLVNVFNVITAQSSTVNTGGTSVALSPTYDITIGSTGYYKVDFWASFSSAAANKIVTFTPFIDGSAGLVEVNRKCTANDLGVSAFGGVIQYTAGNKIDMRVSVNSTTSTLTFHAAGFSVFRVG